MNLIKNITELSELNSVVIAELEQDIFTDLERERINWLIPNIKKDDNVSAHETEISQCFSRIIALSLNLELPIGAFIRSLLELEKHLPLSAKLGLVKNIQDEEKHEQAFRNVARTYAVFDSDLKIANEYRKLLVKYPAHPLIKSRDLETIVFIAIQTCLRYFGSQSLERLVGYISLDEFRHLQYGWEITDILGLGFDYQFENHLIEICQWTFEPLQNTPLNHNYWMQGVNEMREDGESKQFNDLMSYGICTCPFEISNNNY